MVPATVDGRQIAVVRPVTRDQANEQQSVMCFVRQWAASTSRAAPAAGQDVVSGHVGELQPAVAVKFVTPPSAGRADTDNQGHVSNHFGV